MGQGKAVNGVYQSYGDMRRVALELAIESAAMFNPDSLATDDVVARAESYFLFLTEDS